MNKKELQDLSNLIATLKQLKVKEFRSMDLSLTFDSSAFYVPPQPMKKEESKDGRFDQYTDSYRR